MVKRDTFSEEENKMYQDLWKSAKSRFNILFQNGSLLKNYAHVLEMLLRLRQACNHPFLALKNQSGAGSNSLMSPSLDSKDDSATSAIGGNESDWSSFLDFINNNPNHFTPYELGKKLKKILGKGIKDQECTICYDTLENPSITTCGHFFCTSCIQSNLIADTKINFNMSPQSPSTITTTSISASTGALLISPSRSQTESPRYKTNVLNMSSNCVSITPNPSPHSTPPMSPKIIKPSSTNLVNLSPKSSYENVPMSKIQNINTIISNLNSSMGESEKIFLCPICKQSVKYSTIKSISFKNKIYDYPLSPSISHTSHTNSHSANSSNTGNHNSNSNNIKIKKPIYDSSNWKSSTKIDSLLDELNKVLKNEPDSKCLIFSQWTSMLDLIEIPLNINSMPFVRLDGKIPQKQREVAIKRFKEEPSIKIFLISIKAGGLGLNLVVASHVFLCDPWWNPATEEQAIDRVYRIGQNKNVNVIRFFIKDSIEEKILELQKSKKDLAKEALTMKKQPQQRIEELKLLFAD
ncbi:hypothetical protein DICPUDRAFT_87450 [Dictyostelium purpureum]|uniref:SNF2-related domain-containing protein n=1 Tax=Dictyostelium purpureum TaxID=5786 RepID=F0ZI72_DICPU|nr:uncharacterized protein DICPUDRAFT_87450 [Dictyostelium purpureum]EGC36370.1 hypothetical protein DICPUDRAFT_87450 [Dictyostelium purpureum]|eukprot:XP_003287124.1 hypothetical protein DICPUDRAFT_87450 [Dictyostelium purpureum]